MGMQHNQFLKTSLLVISLVTLAACSSTSEPEEVIEDNQGSSSSGSSASTTSAVSSGGQLTQEEIRAQNALRQTVFYFDFDLFSDLFLDSL